MFAVHKGSMMMNLVDVVHVIFSGGILAAIFSWQKNKIDMQKLYAETVSQSRMAWITSFRNDMGTIVAAVKMRNSILKGFCCNVDASKDNYAICEPCQKKYYTEIVPEALKAVSVLRTRLNMNILKKGNEYNDILEKMLCDIDFYAKKEGDVSDNDLIDITRKILESEWGRVKDEAKGMYNM